MVGNSNRICKCKTLSIHSSVLKLILGRVVVSCIEYKCIDTHAICLTSALSNQQTANLKTSSKRGMEDGAFMHNWLLFCETTVFVTRKVLTLLSRHTCSHVLYLRLPYIK
jgi:hypothetical protein